MKVIKLGKTDLPMDVIDEYVQSLESIYTPESYDLFLHNCNNFTQDLAMFVVGKSIPEEIRSLPETFLRTPMGQMLRSQLDQSMRTMTQAPDAVSGRNAPTTNGVSRPNPIRTATNGTYQPPRRPRPSLTPHHPSSIQGKSITSPPSPPLTPISPMPDPPAPSYSSPPRPAHHARSSTQHTTNLPLPPAPDVHSSRSMSRKHTRLEVGIVFVLHRHS